MSEYLTIAEIAELADVPNSTSRRYLADFEAFFMVKGGSRAKKYEVGAVDILKRIKQLYDDGLGTNEIHNVLVKEFPLVVDSEKQQQKENAAPTTGLATSEDIAEIKKAMELQQEFNKQLLEKLDQQNEYIKESLDRRDRELMKSIRDLQETKRLTAVSEEPEKKKSFLSRLFGR